MTCRYTAAIRQTLTRSHAWTCEPSPTPITASHEPAETSLPKGTLPPWHSGWAWPGLGAQLWAADIPAVAGRDEVLDQLDHRVGCLHVSEVTDIGQQLKSGVRA